MLVEEKTIPRKFNSDVWINIGELLHNLSNGSEEGCRIFQMYTELLNPNFEERKEHECYSFWENLSLEKWHRNQITETRQ